ncbi:MAG: DNA gyrase subunit A [Novosphingobium sp.]|nr:DNA gyrase subunit A [Novosphingobium sp.]
MSDDSDIPDSPAPDPEFQRIDIVEEMKTSYLDYAMSVIVSRALPDVRDGLKPVRLARVASSALLDDIDKDTVDFIPNYEGTEREPVALPARFPNLLVNGAGGIAVGMATNIPPHNLGEVIDACLAMIDNPLVSLDELIEIVPGPDFPTAPLILGTAGARAAYTTGRGSVLQRARHVIEEGRGDRRSIVLTSIPYQVGKNGLVEKIAEAAKDKRIEGVSDIRDESSRKGVRVVIDLKRDATPDVVLNQLWRHTPAQSSFPANMLAIRGGRPETLNLKEILEAFVRFREEVITRRTKFELNKARDRAHLLLGLVIAVTNLDEVVRIIRGARNPAAAREQLLAREWPVGEIAQYIRLVEAIDDSEEVDGGIYKLSELQVRAILELRLHRLTALGRDEIGNELEGLATAIQGYLEILADRVKLYAVMRDELAAVREAFATPRLSEITQAWDGIEDEDLIEREEMVVTVTLDGYIKRTALSTFRAQNRGGKGRAGMATKQEDAVATMFVTSTHNPVLFFSTAGKVYRLKVWRLPEGGPATRGRPAVNLLPALDQGETIAAVLPLPEDEAEWGNLNVVFATARGGVRRNAMDAFANIPSNGKYAMRFEEGSDDRLIGVALTQPGDDVLLASKCGKAIRFPADDVREFVSRTSTGVRGMRLGKDDEVISLSILHRVGVRDQDERDDYLRHAPWKADKDSEPAMTPERFAELVAKEQFILTVCANGYGKLSSAYEYRRTGRGGQGITNIDNIKRNGPVVASFAATQADQLMLVTDQAKLIRLPLETVRVIGRGSAGVRLFNVADDEHVVSAVRLVDTGDDEASPDESEADGA